jgi:hypothetical protein
LLLLILIESTLISYPFVFILIFLLFMRYQSISTLIIVLLISSILDAIRVVPVGTTALFSFTIFFILFLYNRTIQLGEMALLFVAGFFITLGYSYIADYPINALLHILVFLTLFCISYLLHQKKLRQKMHATYIQFQFKK